MEQNITYWQEPDEKYLGYLNDSPCIGPKGNHCRPQRTSFGITPRIQQGRSSWHQEG